MPAIIDLLKKMFVDSLVLHAKMMEFHVFDKLILTFNSLKTVSVDHSGLVHFFIENKLTPLVEPVFILREFESSPNFTSILEHTFVPDFIPGRLPNFIEASLQHHFG